MREPDCLVFAAMGLFVAAPGWAGVFCMATDPQHRRQGIANAVLHAGALLDKNGTVVGHALLDPPAPS